ncbi:MAG: Smr/MutS family protein [Vicinamibacterales bacterium]
MTTISSGALRALEFARVVSVLEALAVTPPGRRALAAISPLTTATAVIAAQRATTEGVRFLTIHPGFPLSAPTDLDTILAGLTVEGRALDPLHLLALSEYLESVDKCRSAIRSASGSFPLLERIVGPVASFTPEITDVRRKIDGSGDVVDSATPALGSIRARLRTQRGRLRSTLEGFIRGRDTAKYLQDQVITDRNGRYVLVVRAEHRGAIPGIVHGASSSGASLYLEPLGTVEINNDIVGLEEEEAEEVRRILLALTDAFRVRSDDVSSTSNAATELDVVQGRARLAEKLQGIEADISLDGTFELRSARHPLLVLRRSGTVVPVDILLIPPARILVIAGPNTGGKTVALKTAGLLALMAQAGLHIPVEHGSRLPVFGSVFADIGDDQSIAASLSTFSAHITNVVSMDRDLRLPCLVLLDEVGAGTDPVEGGALGMAVIDHFRRRGSHLVATTHYEALKSYATTTDGVVGAAFGFSPENFAPTYRLLYGTAGRSLAIEMAARLGMPASVIAAARNNLTEEQKQLADHLKRMDDDLRALEAERRLLHKERAEVAASEKQLRGREEGLREREEALRKRVSARVDDQVKEARKEIDAIIGELKAKSDALAESAARQLREGPRLRPAITTGDTGSVRASAQSAVDQIAARLKRSASAEPARPQEEAAEAVPVSVGARVSVGGLGLEGVVIELHGSQAEVDVRGKRLRARITDLRVVGGATAPKVSVNIDLQPRESSLTELNVIGCTVDEAVTRTERFLDEASVTDIRGLRIVHGHGTGQLRRAIAELLRSHPLVAHFELAPQNQGGGGATVVELKD